MIENAPVYLHVTFLAATVFVAFMFLKACKWNKIAMALFAIWLPSQAYLGYNGFYLNTASTPSPMIFLIPPTLVLIVLLFATASGRRFIDTLDLKTLTLLHTVRIPVELCLYWLFVVNAVPELMTFEGTNFDIIAGITAPILYYLFFVKKSISRKVLLGWNIVMLLLLLNIVIIALLSAPLPIQQFAFDQPNVGILYFPFVWLPSFIVPIVLFSHLVTIWRLRKVDSEVA